MEKINYQNVIDKIVERFPEYKNSSQYWDEFNQDLPYIVLGNLSLMAFTDLDKKTDISLAERLVKLTDEIMNNPDSEVDLVNLFQVCVFEQLVGSKKGAVLAKKFLHNKSIENLKQTLTGYGTKEFEEEYSKNGS